MDGFMPGTTGNFTANTWKDILTHAKAYSYKASKTLEALGAEDLKDIKQISHYAKDACSKNVFTYLLEDFFAANGYMLVAVDDLTEDVVGMPRYVDVEYDYGKFKSCLEEGSYIFLKPGDAAGTYDDVAVIVSLKPGWTNYTLLINFMAKRSNEVELEELYTAFKAYVDKNNFYRGKRLVYPNKYIVNDKKYTWDDVILSSDVKDALVKNISPFVNNYETYKKYLVKLKRGVVFSGPPGTGKTKVLKVLMDVIPWTFVYVTSKNFRMASDVSSIISFCRSVQPVILVFEDIDLYAKSRDLSLDSTILGELMNQLDGAEDLDGVLTIATTNQPQVLEKALLSRPGRFDVVINFDRPGVAERSVLLERLISSVDSAPLLKEDVAVVVEATDGLTGAQIEELVNTARLISVDAALQQNSTVEPAPLSKDVLLECLSGVKKKEPGRVGFLSGLSTSSRTEDSDSDDRCLDDL